MNDPAPLPDLVPAPPRVVRAGPGRARLFSRSYLITWSIVTAAGILFLLVSLLLPTLHVAGILFGATVTGHITEKSTIRASRVTYYNVVYSFTSDERTYAANTTVDLEIYQLAQKGDPVQVRVLPCCPEQGPRVLDAGYGTPFGIWLFLLGMFVFNVYLTESGTIPLWRLWRQRELVKNGMPTIGWLTRKEVVNGWRRTYHIHYRFRIAGDSR